VDVAQQPDRIGPEADYVDRQYLVELHAEAVERVRVVDRSAALQGWRCG
jgi:hypothetical protein